MAERKNTQHNNASGSKPGGKKAPAKASRNANERSGRGVNQSLIRTASQRMNTRISERDKLGRTGSDLDGQVDPLP